MNRLQDSVGHIENRGHVGAPVEETQRLRRSGGLTAR